jgi:acetyl-CoA carboxylase biotin carboxyl carrier protein
VIKEKEKIRRLLKFADKSGLVEFHYEDEEIELELHEESAVAQRTMQETGEETALRSAEKARRVRPARALPAETRKVVEPSSEIDPELKIISSPMNGTFYRSPAPGKPPFVEIGTIVEVGDTVAIIEAMKLMNKLKSEIRGKIERILLDNAAAVNKGQMIFLVRPL